MQTRCEKILKTHSESQKCDLNNGKHSVPGQRMTQHYKDVSLLKSIYRFNAPNKNTNKLFNEAI